MVKNFFLISNLNLPSFNLQPFPLVLSLHTLVKSPSPSFCRPLQVLEGCSKVTPEPSPLQAEQLQLPHSVLIGEVCLMFQKECQVLSFKSNANTVSAPQKQF